MAEQRKLRFAVLVDSKILKKWQVDSIQYLLDTQESEFIGFIQNESVIKHKSKSSLGFRYIFKKIDHFGPLQLVKWEENFAGAATYKFSPKVKGIANYLEKEDLETLKSLNLDFLLRFGFGILKGEALTIPRYGVWSFHHGDPRKYRGGPAGFWEIFKADPVTGSILQQLNEKLDQGKIIQEGFFKTIDHSYKANLFHLLEETASWPALAVKAIAHHPQHSLVLKTNEVKGKLYKIPGNLVSVQFIFLVFFKKIKFHLNRLFKAEKWNVGQVFQPIQTLVNQPIESIKWLKEAPKNNYYADPFGWSDNEILIELFDYKSGKGSLQKIDINSGNWSDILHDEIHFSYPFCIKEKGKKYILPENYKSKRLYLYEVDDHLKVIKTHLLLDGAWIDPTIFKMDGKWWLSCMNHSSPRENLYLFYSNSIEGSYRPHSLNPVLTDIRSARPGGTPFVIDNKIIRPTQNCSQTYGGSIVLKQIDKLSPNEFQEHRIKEIFPQKGKYSKGLHTLSANGNKILVDGKRYYFNFWNFWNQLSASFKKKIN